MNSMLHMEPIDGYLELSQDSSQSERRGKADEIPVTPCLLTDKVDLAFKDGALHKLKSSSGYTYNPILV